MNEDPPVLYFDLDGTLLDIREKYHRLHRRIATDLGHEPLPLSIFWTRKRRGATLEALLPDWEEAARREYARRWLGEVELPLYTRFDRLVPGARHTLVRLAREFELVLITLRRDGRELRQQLRDMGLDLLFSRLLVSGDYGAGELTKTQLLSLGDRPKKHRSIVIGDTEEDVSAARAMRAPVIVVLTGMRDRAFLAALSPDLIIESVAQLPAALRVAPPLPAAGCRHLKAGLP